MAFNTEIVTEAEVNTYAINKVGFDTAPFANYIITSQRKYIRVLLGEDWYNEILTEIETATLTANNTLIVDNYLKQMLSHYIVYEAYSQIHVQLTNQGSMLNGTEFSRQGSDFDYASSRDFYIDKADTWRVQMIDYIKEQRDDDSDIYPLFKNLSNKDQVNKKGFLFY